MKEKVVVTGGGGFIGSHIADALVERGYDVHVIDTFVAGKREHVPAAAIVHEVDITDTEAIRPILAGARAVFHEAALPRVQFSIDEPLESHRINVDGTLSVLYAAHKGKVGKVIFAASSSAYGNQETLPLHEGLPPTPVNPYGLHKYIGEEYMKLFAKLYGLPTVSLRYFNVYGPRLDPEGPYALVIGRFLKQIQNREPVTILGDGEQTRDFIHVRDIVRANLMALESPVGNGEVINIGAGRSITVNELADLLGATEKVSLSPRVEARHSRADIRRAKELLGWEPEVQIEDGIKELRETFGV